MSDIKRTEIITGLHVKVVIKEDQWTDKFIEDVVKDILTKSPKHPHGIKVRLETGEVACVMEIVEWKYLSVSYYLKNRVLYSSNYTP
jgi:uncharacterized repeat protein (TIGR03833 family)